MNKPAFIRFGILGGSYFDIPYVGEAPFKSVVTMVRSDQGFHTQGLFIPYHAIAFMHEVPAQGEPAWAASTGTQQ